MRCPSCDALLSDEGGFCPHCGARLTSAAAESLFVVHPTAIFIVLRYLAALGLIIALALLYTAAERWRPGAIPSWVLLLAVILVLISPLTHHLARSCETYRLTEHDLILTSGILRRFHRHIPLSKIHEVTVIQSGAQRALGIGDIVIDTAAEAGRIVLRDVRRPRTYADLILRQIARQ